MSRGDLGHLTDEEVREVRNRVAQARGLMKSVMDILDGQGGEHRDHLAEALGHLNFEEVAMNNHVELRKREDE